jgi:hypothetical protein
MTMAIRIIRANAPSDANLRAVEREEQILAVARRMAEATGSISQDRVDSCAAKLRAAALTSASASRSPSQIAKDITARLAGAPTNDSLLTHTDLDLDRIMALLEG